MQRKNKTIQMKSGIIITSFERSGRVILRKLLHHQSLPSGNVRCFSFWAWHTCPVWPTLQSDSDMMIKSQHWQDHIDAKAISSRARKGYFVVLSFGTIQWYIVGKVGHEKCVYYCVRKKKTLTTLLGLKNWMFKARTKISFVLIGRWWLTMSVI